MVYIYKNSIAYIESIFLLWYDENIKDRLKTAGLLPRSFCILEGICMEKYFSLPSEKVKILRQRGMSIRNSTSQKNLLKKYNYYNLVNAYKDPFLINRAGAAEKYRAGTTLHELAALLQFDSKLRLLFLREILKLEEIFKNQVVQSFYAHHL